jgi:flagellar biosynthetic protein FliR
MPNLLAFDPAQYVGFILIFARISGLMIVSPILGDQNIPPQIKVAFTFILSLIFFPVLAAPRLPANPDVLEIMLLMATEVGVGLLIGFAARLLFTGVAMAGEVVGYQMGLGIANVFDPSSDTQISLIGQIQTIFALLIFVVLDGHHLLIRALMMSYQRIPPGGLALSRPLYEHFVRLGGNIFVVGLQIGAPLIVAMMAANFSIGLVARSVPQVNVIVVGFPFTIALGLLLLALGFPFFIEALVALFNQLDSVLVGGLNHG